MVQHQMAVLSLFPYFFLHFFVVLFYLYREHFLFDRAYSHLFGAAFHHIGNDPLPRFQRMSLPTAFYRMEHIMEDEPTIMTLWPLDFRQWGSVKSSSLYQDGILDISFHFR